MVIKVRGSPEVRGQETVGLLQSVIGSFQEVTSSSGSTHGFGMTILDTSHSQDLLGGLGADQTSTSWGWNKSNSDGTASTGKLAWDGMGLTDLIHVITSSDWDDVEFGINDSTLDGTLDVLGGFDTESNMSVEITDDDESLESGSLTGSGLFLDRHDFHNFLF